MTSIQSWLLLPSSWCEDEHFYPTLPDQGSEQPLFQPLDHQATSLPSRGERALSQEVCSSHLHGFLQLCHFLQLSWRLAPGVPSLSILSLWSKQQELPPGADSLCSNKAWSLHCPFTASSVIAFLLLLWISKCFLKIG